MVKILIRFALVATFLLMICGCLYLYDHLEFDTGARASSSSNSFSGSWDSSNNATSTDPTLVATSTNPTLGDAKLLSATSTIEAELPNSDNIFVTGFTTASGTTATTIHLLYEYTFDDTASTTSWSTGYEGTYSSGVRTLSVAQDVLSFPTSIASSSYYWITDVPTYRAKKIRVSYSYSTAESDTTDVPFVYLNINHK